MPPLAGFYDEVLLNSQGVLYSLKNASVLVKNLDGTNAVLYTSSAMTATTSNPVQADSLGNITFWAENGQYDLVVTPQGGTAQPAYRVRTTVAPGTAMRLNKHDQAALTAFDRWDDFNRANGPLTTRALMPSGQTWTIGSTEVGNGSVVIRDDRLVFDVAGATYIRVGGRDYRRISATFSFGAGSTDSATATLVSSKMPVGNPATGATGIATNSVHASFWRNGWNIGIFDGTTLQIFASHTLDVAYAALAQDVPVKATLELVDTERLRIHLPDGQVVEVTDALIKSRTTLSLRLRDWWGPTALIEHYQPSASFATDRRPAFHSFGVSGPVIPIDPWHVVGAAGEPAFNAPWRGFVGYQAPRFRKVSNLVYLDGVLGHDAAANASTAFVLPVGYRPPVAIIPYGLNRLDVLADGSVVCRGVSAGSFHPMTCSFWID